MLCVHCQEYKKTQEKEGSGGENLNIVFLQITISVCYIF